MGQLFVPGRWVDGIDGRGRRGDRPAIRTESGLSRTPGPGDQALEPLEFFIRDRFAQIDSGCDGLGFRTRVIGSALALEPGLEAIAETSPILTRTVRHQVEVV